jgi:polar amino acid transport system permease protein
MRSTASRTSLPRDEGRLLARALLTAGVLGGVLAFLILAPTYYDWNWEGVWRDGDYASLLFGGLAVTAWISAGGLVLGLLLGFAGAWARMARHWAPNQLGALYVEMVRGTPLLVQIFIAKYCVATAVYQALVGAGLDKETADVVREPALVGVLTLGVFAGAYVTEIVRAAVLSVDPGQREAALSQGMSRRQSFWLVLFPQALRRMVPPLTGEFVSLVKDSSLLSIIAVPELMKRAGEVRASTRSEFEVLLPLAVLYLAITFPLSRLARRLELRLAA